MICEDPKFIFVHIPKTAGNSIMRGLNSALDGTAVPNQKNPPLREYIHAHWEGAWPNHAPLKYVKGYLGDAFWDYFRFAFVRNPWDRVVSDYFHNRRQGTQDYEKRGKEVPAKRLDMLERDFEDWVLNGELGYPQTTKICEDGKLLTNFVGKTENAQNDMDEVCQQLGLPPIELPSRNVGTHAPYRDYYSQKSRQAVADRFASDIAAFGYRF